MADVSSKTGAIEDCHAIDSRHSRQTRLHVEAEPLRWQEMEALRYYYQAVRPALVAYKENVIDPQIHHARYNPQTLICLMASYNIAQVRKVHLNFTKPGEDPALAGLWAAYHRHTARYIRQINLWIQQNDPRAFAGIAYLVIMDVELNLSFWQGHINGYLALVQHLGGAEAVLSLAYSPIVSFSVILIKSVFHGTTSPPNKHIRGIDLIQDDTIRALYDAYGNGEMYCPRETFLTICHINRLRVNVATTTPTNTDAVARDLFDTLERVDTDSWIREKKWEKRPEVRCLAQIFQVAAGLYGIVALPQAAVASWAVSAGHGDGTRLSAYNDVRTLYRLKLIKLLRKICLTLKELRQINWPLVVAGVATTADDAGDRDWIAQRLYDTWQQECTQFPSIICRNKLRDFWKSGKSAWDDCFDEPVPVCVG
ncbi:hypothetical protein NLG97_g5669 [Lecanicillium saksenae]|uniref:Uncharacterized protein n=1 Tax=Lecanicillium saksenae TaxID=468837 RepID=A0ACC1QV04_9HYPO|nr:hypothetical protein NLG97_g5669 [Lecanicillium saksenae]